MGRSDITVVSISVDPNKSYKRGNFLRNCGTAFVGEYRKVIWYHQLRWLPNKSCLSSNNYGLQTLKYGWKAPAALSMTIFKAVKRMTTWNLLETGGYLNHLKVSEWEIPMQRCQPLEIYEYHQAPLSNHSDWLNGKKKLFYRPVYGVSFGKFKILEFHLSCFVADAATTPRKQRYLALVSP